LLSEKGENRSLRQRVADINATRPDLLISIHHDSVQPIYLSHWEYDRRLRSFSDRYQGYSLFISGKNHHADQSLCLAGLIASALRDKGLVPSFHHGENIPGERRPILDRDKGIFSYDGLVVLREVSCPAVLIECGIIKNREEELRLSSLPHRNKMVSALHRGIVEFRTSCRLPFRK
jgi:N-acetylmuramoyl-L-alanine amidase